MTDATIGDNSAGLSIAEQIAENLKEKHADLAKRAAELTDMLTRVPEKAETRDVADKMSEAVRQCREFNQAAESLRVKEKEPYLASERAVDAFFKNLKTPVERVMAIIGGRRTDYDIMVEREERRAREAAAKAERELAEAAAKEAADTIRNREQAEDRAALAATRAEQAEQAAKARSVDLTRTRSDSGVTTSLKTEWRFEIAEPKRVPKKYCTPNEGLIRAAVKAATKPDGTNDLDIPGVRIFPHKFSAVR